MNSAFSKTGRTRAVIERVSPEVDNGRFPVKRTVDEDVIVEADIILTKKGMRKYGSCKIYRAPPGCAPSSRDDRAPASSDRLKGGLEPSLDWPA